jgi:hypothetical protein
MPYPESCPECGGVFRNTGTHFTARRNEIGRHVLLELGCQNTTRRFWWDFTTASVTEDGRTIPARRAPAPPVHAVDRGAARNGITNGHVAVSTLERPETLTSVESSPTPIPANANGEAQSRAFDLATLLSASLAGTAQGQDGHDSTPPVVPRTLAGPDGSVSPTAATSAAAADAHARAESTPTPSTPADESVLPSIAAAADAHESALADTDDEESDEDMPEPSSALTAQAAEALPFAGSPPTSSVSLKEAFVRQLQLDRLTFRQMRSWLMSDEARRAIEVAAGATEATYERLALILFGDDLSQLLGKPLAPVPANGGMSAEERLELQREKARIRARLRRAAAKAARLNEG